MFLRVVQAEPACWKPRATNVNMHIFRGERCGLGAPAPSLTRALLISFSGAKGSAILPKLVKLVGSSSTQADKISLYLSSSASAPSVSSKSFCLVLRLMLQSC